MKIEYLRGIGDIRFLSSATRILSSNLVNNSKLDVRFNPASFTTDVHTVKYIIDIMRNNKVSSLIKASTELWFIPARLILSTTKFISKIVDNIENEIVLYSAHVGIYDYYPMKKLLDSGFKVVVGGPTAIIAGPEKIRKRLLQLGCCKKSLDNLIIVSGYVDLTTDIYEIIKNWKDVTISRNNFNTMWECNYDPFQKYFGILKQVLKDYPGGNFNKESILNVVVFRNFCHWGRCSFCHYPFVSKNNYIENCDIKKIAYNIIDSCNLYKVNNVFISDGCFIFNNEVEKVLDILVKNGIKLTILMRIPFLKNKKIIKKINKYISMLDVGIESFNDFTLDYINKGYKKKDIIEAFDAMSKFLDNSIRINPYLILDLPFKNKEQLMKNYEDAIDLQHKMQDQGFQFKYTPNLLEITWDTKDSLIDNRYLKLSSGGSQGRHIAFNFMEEIGLISKDEYDYLAIPFQRYDEHGKLMKSDLYQIPETYTDLFCSKYGV